MSTGTEDDGWYSTEAATFGDRLAGARDAAGLDQEEFARRLGIKLKTVEAWENDQSEPRANKLQMVAGLLNVSIRWLLIGQGNGPEEPVDPETTRDFNQFLLDLRQVRTQYAQLGETLGRLEKRLRLMLPPGGSDT